MLKTSHQDWVILGTVNLDEFLDANLREVEQWEANFKTLKKRRKDAERLPDSQRIGIFVVSFIPFKNAVEDQMSRFSDALMTSLRKSTVMYS
jgi:dynein heavy chain 2